MDILLCLASSILCGISFITENTWPLIFFAPALYFLSLSNGKKSFFKGFLFGFVFYLFNSVFLSSLDLSHLSESSLVRKFFPFVAYLLVISAEGIFMGIFGKIYSLLMAKTKDKFHPLLFSAMWVIYEFIIALPVTFLGYPWGRISLPLAAIPSAIQTASLFGMLYLSFMIIYFASSLAMSLRLKKLSHMIMPIALLLVNTTFSSFMYNKEVKGTPIDVKCVQNGYGAFEKWATPPAKIIDEAIEEFDDAHLVVFAESAIPMYLNKSPFLDELTSAAKEKGVTVLTGALYMSSTGEKYTSAYLIPSSDGQVLHKRHLVPFGEHYPILDLFSKDLKESGFSEGNSSEPLTNDNLSLGAIICFDSMFPDFSRETVKNGANILCVITNDSWFKKGKSAELHLAHSVFRSIETGRYSVRSACTGISAVIDSKGNILSSLPRGQEDSLVEKAYLIGDKTLYTYLGDLPILAFSLSAIIFSLTKGRKKND